MGFTRNGDDRVLGQRELAALKVFLQECFRILAQGLEVQFLEQRREKHDYGFFRRGKPAVEIDRAQHGLQRIGKNGGAPFASTLELSFAKPDQSAQSERLRQFSQRLLIDQVGSNAGEVAFADDRVEYRNERQQFSIGHAGHFFTRCARIPSRRAASCTAIAD